VIFGAGRTVLSPYSFGALWNPDVRPIANSTGTLRLMFAIRPNDLPAPTAASDLMEPSGWFLIDPVVSFKYLDLATDSLPVNSLRNPKPNA
jgi:hypothetical protein